MQLPTREEFVEQVRALAIDESLEVERKAARQMDNLGYTGPDVCDMLYELECEDCEKKIEPSHWRPDVPVGTFHTWFTKDGRDEPDELFVEVGIRYDQGRLLFVGL